MAAGMQSEPVPVLDRRKPDDPRLISLTQRRLWYLDQLTPGTGVYNVPYVMRVSGLLEVEALQKSLHALVGRHEVLRTVFLAPGGNPVPVVLKKWNVELQPYDLRQQPEADREREAEVIVQREAARPFSFTRDLMLRAALIRMADDDWRLVHTTHHIATEFSSTEIIYRELAAFYEEFTGGKPANLPELPIQYSDFALWQHRYLQGARLESMMAYWKEQLGGAAQLNLPTDRPRPAVATLRGTRYPCPLTMEQIRDIAALSKASKTTPFRGTYAAFNVFLHCWSGQEDFSVGSPVAPRSHPGQMGVIGFFVNTLVLRTVISGDPTFREIMQRADKSVQGAVDHAECTFDKLVEALKPPREAARMPLFQVNFRILKAPVPALQLPALEITPPRFVDTQTAKFDLALELEAGTGQGGFFEYSTDLFERSTIAQMSEDFPRILLALIAEPDKPISKVGAVSEVKQRVAKKLGSRR
jgi:hypothetical protein